MTKLKTPFTKIFVGSAFIFGGSLRPKIFTSSYNVVCNNDTGCHNKETNEIVQVSKVINDDLGNLCFAVTTVAIGCALLLMGHIELYNAANDSE